VEGAELAIFNEAVEYGGTERVLQTLADRFPAATIFSNHFEDFAGGDHDQPAFMARASLIPSGRRKRHFLGLLYARRLAAAPVPPVRVVLTLASGGWGLAAPSPPGARVVCYSTGPPPALYGEENLYLQRERAVLRPILRAGAPAQRRFYRRLMRRPHRLITVSSASAAAIDRVYDRAAEVIHPPVRTAFFTPDSAPRRHFLAVSRIVPQKRLGVLVEAFRDLDETLVIAGCGPWLERLRTQGPPNVSFAGWVDDSMLRDLYRQSHALICPSVEDFGIVMGEAHACGVPVIAPWAGGAMDIVDTPATGILVDRIDARSLAAAVRQARRRPFDPVACRASAKRFSEERFVAQMEHVIAEELAMAEKPPRVPSTPARIPTAA
jgi:glycosyltransferase involved in cell wall biosynthesis